MVSNALGSFWSCAVYPLGWRCRTVPVSECRLSFGLLLIVLQYRGTCLWLWLGVLDAVQGVGLYVHSRPGISFQSDNRFIFQGYDSAPDFVSIACVRHISDCANAGFGRSHHRQGHRSEQSKSLSRPTCLVILLTLSFVRMGRVACSLMQPFGILQEAMAQ